MWILSLIYHSIALCSSVSFLTEGQSEANMQCMRILPPAFIWLASGYLGALRGNRHCIHRERDSNIALECNHCVKIAALDRV